MVYQPFLNLTIKVPSTAMEEQWKLLLMHMSM
ncbi:hypothetical protein Taro_043293 [Colocasia esculenta]|uniref:Uncharacterized protein n=1 Tax=Colocasia esculenta TaxID=4460 RepID=A0A843WR09_COLES|nr:hypothetical protein [Colocasia esculenta]